MNRSTLLTVPTTVSGWIALAALALPAASPARIVIGVAFVTCGPGAAVVGLTRALLRRRGRSLDGWEAAMLVVVVSVSLCALVAEAFYLTHSFSTVRCTVVLAVLTSIAALWPVQEPDPRRSGTGGAGGASCVNAARRGHS